MDFKLGENIVVTEAADDDLYVIAGNANLEADIAGDLYVVGGIVTINGDVHEDVVVVGGRVTITGNILGDLRVVGGQVGMYGNVGDDVLVAGGQVDIGNNSVVGGSLIAGSGILTIDGFVEEDVRGGLGMFILNGTVEGDVIITIEDSMLVSDGAQILGDLRYSALLEADIPATVVAGETSFNRFEREAVLSNVTYLVFVYKILSYVAALILALLFALFAPKMLVNSAKLTRESILKTFGIGLLGMVVAFIGSIILMVTIVGIPLALIVFSVLLIVIYIAKIFTAVWLSSYLLNFKRKLSRLKLFGALALMLFVYYLLGFIPYVGWVIHIVLFLIGVGALILVKRDCYLFLKNKDMA